MAHSLLIPVLLASLSLVACGEPINHHHAGTPAAVAETVASRELASLGIDQHSPGAMVKAEKPDGETAVPPMPAAILPPSSRIHSLITLRNTPCWVPYC